MSTASLRYWPPELPADGVVEGHPLASRVVVLGLDRPWDRPRGSPEGLLSAAGAVDLELPQRVAVDGAALGPVDAHVATAPRDAQVVDPPGAGGGGVDGGPARGVARDLDLVGAAEGGLPVEHHARDRVGGAEVHVDPLGIAERAGPAGGGVAVDGARRRIAGALVRGRDRGPPLGEQRLGLGVGGRQAGDETEDEGCGRGQACGAASGAGSSGHGHLF